MGVIGHRRERMRVSDGAVRRLSPRVWAELILVIGSIALLAVSNGELAAARSQLLDERARLIEANARVDRVVDEIQGMIIEIIAPGASPETPLP